MIHLLFCFMLASNVFAQNVTSSFDRNVLSTNPSAAATRGFAQLSMGHTFKGVETKVNPDALQSDQYEEEVQLNSTELRITGGHRRYVPELYIGFNDVKKVTERVGTSEKLMSDTTFIDNSLSLGVWATKRISIGLRTYFPNIAFNQKYPGTTKDGTSYMGNSEVVFKTTGVTLGATLVLVRGFFVSAFGNFDKQKSSFVSRRLDYESNQVKKDDGSFSEDISRYGFGISYLTGSSLGHGFRTELSYSFMQIPEGGVVVADQEKAEEIKASMEMAWKGISFGGRIRMIRNGFYDQGDYIQRYFIQEPPTVEFVSSYGGFFSLNSKRGHSFGFSGYALPAEGIRTLDNGVRAPSKSKTIVMSFNYSYLF